MFIQFKNNPKYKHYAGDTINYDEDIDYEILAHDKRYSATFFLSDTTSIASLVVMTGRRINLSPNINVIKTEKLPIIVEGTIFAT